MNVSVTLPAWELSPDAIKGLENKSALEAFRKDWNRLAQFTRNELVPTFNMDQFLQDLITPIDRALITYAKLAASDSSLDDSLQDSDILALRDFIIRTQEEIKNRNPPKVRFVLAGKTGVGKSTLFGALTKSADQSKQSGGKTGFTESIEVGECFFNPNFEIVDTPGIGAQDSQHHVERALNGVKDADFVLWVTKSDVPHGIDETSAFSTVLAMGKPVILLENIATPITKNGQLNQSLCDKLLSKYATLEAKQREHSEVYRSRAQSLGYQIRETLFIHAQAGFFGVTGEISDSIFKLSHFSDLEDLIQHLASEKPEVEWIREFIKIKAHTQEVLIALMTQGNYLRVNAQNELAKILDLTSSIEKALDQSRQQTLKSHEENVAKAIRRAGAMRVSSRSEINDRHEEIEGELKHATEQLLEKHVGILHKKINSVIDKHQTDWSIPLDIQPEQLKLRRAYKNWIRKAINLILDLAVTFSDKVPLIGPFLKFALQNIRSATRKRLNSLLIKSGLSTKSQEIEKHRSKVRERIQALSTDIEIQVTNGINDLENKLKRLTKFQIKKINALFNDQVASADSFIEESKELLLLMRELDKHYARSSTHVSGRLAEADEIHDAKWIPGTALLISCNERLLTDLTLFPINTPDGGKLIPCGDEPLKRLPKLVRSLSASEIKISFKTDSVASVKLNGSLHTTFPNIFFEGLSEFCDLKKIDLIIHEREVER